MDLTYLHKFLSNATTEGYDQKLAERTSDKGDCCMMTLLEWGHSRDYIVGDIADFDDEDHVNYHGEVKFIVNETCLSCDHEAFLVHKTDRDAHNPLLIHFVPHMTHNESRTYRSARSKIENKKRRREKQKENRQQSHAEQEDDNNEQEETWVNYTQEEWWTWQRHERQRQRDKGRGRGHYSTGYSSSSWQPRYQQWR